MSRPSAAPWGAVLAVLAVLVAFVWAVSVAGERRAECQSIGGTYVSGGKYGDTTCIKDGRIIIVWKLGGKVTNP